MRTTEPQSNVSQDVAAAVDLDISGYSVTENFQRINKDRVSGYLRQDSRSNNEKSPDLANLRYEGNACASEVTNQRKLVFKKNNRSSSRPNSTIRTAGPLQQPSISHNQRRADSQLSIARTMSDTVNTNKVQNRENEDQIDQTVQSHPMSSKDYYCRLRQMQRRLD